MSVEECRDLSNSIESLLQGDDSKLTQNIIKLIREHNTLSMKTVESLKGFKFLVDKYQRGYKWDKHQVEDLLNDIDLFVINGNNFYSLQPVAVKYLEDGDRWELIDGQQRMSTIYMILKYLDSTDNYTLDYSTREGSKEFLKNSLFDILFNQDWDEFVKNSKNNIDNIDNYHFFNAYITIMKWFDEKKPDEIEYWKKKLLKYTKVIWYVVNTQEEGQTSIDVFRRLNSGKIPLTNAELIKALFLSNSKSNTVSNEVSLTKLELSQEWDMIEKTFHDDEFWHFLNAEESKNIQDTRIELILNYLSKKKPKEHNEFFTFFDYQKKLTPDENKNKQDRIVEQWKEVKKCFYTLKEWYESENLYHLVGFILTRKLKTFEELHDLFLKQKSKTDFVTKLNTIINEKVQQYFTDNENNVSFENLYYGKDNKKIIDILVLLNIFTYASSKTRLSFKKFAEPWSLEHIHAQNSLDLSLKSKIDMYAENIDKLPKEQVSKEKKTDLKNLLNQCTDNPQKMEDFESKYEEIVGTYEGLHLLSNMTLLSVNDNSALGNKYFYNKREEVVELEKNGKSFIPMATRNVFSKFYSKSVSNMNTWSEEDSQAYKQAIIDCLESFTQKGDSNDENYILELNR